MPKFRKLITVFSTFTKEILSQIVLKTKLHKRHKYSECSDSVFRYCATDRMATDGPVRFVLINEALHLIHAYLP